MPTLWSKSFSTWLVDVPSGLTKFYVLATDATTVKLVLSSSGGTSYATWTAGTGLLPTDVNLAGARELKHAIDL